jgi:hypothetical protein
MGANAQTSVPVFTSGQVLTAQQQTEINTGIPVFADSTARDAAFGGTGEKTLAEGQFAFLEDTNATQFYDGSTWNPVGVAPGLVLINTTTIGTTVSSVTVSGAFSSTYDDYLIRLSPTVGSEPLSLVVSYGATATGYYSGTILRTYSNTDGSSATSNGASTGAGRLTATGCAVAFEVSAPNLESNTITRMIFVAPETGGRSGTIAGFLDNTTQYTAFTLTTTVGTITGGTIRVYGYAKS